MASDLDPLSSADTHADSLFAAGFYSRALARYAKGLKETPNDAATLARCATCLLQIGEWRRATPLFAHALRLQPELTEALRGIAIIEAQQGKLETALQAFLHLDQRAPGQASTLHNIGIVCNRLERYGEATRWFKRALAVTPGYADAWIGLAAAQEELDELPAARQSIERALEASPDAPLARLMVPMMSLPALAETSEHSLGVAVNFQDSLVALNDWARRSPRHLSTLGARVGDCQPFLLAYRPGNHRPLLSAYGDLITLAADAYWTEAGLPFAVDHAVRSRPRLAIVCAHIRRHSVWDIILKGFVRHLLRTQFELIIYHTGSETDGETHWAARQAECFVTGPRSPNEWIELIRADAPDVLFFPEVGMDPLSCKLAVLRLAPLQVASWGHPITTGLPEIDLFFSGLLLEPADAQSHYREQLVRLPGTGVCTEWLGLQPAPLPIGYLRRREPQRARLLLCQHPFKFDPGDWPIIAETLQACAPCELYVLKHRRRSRVSERAVMLLRKGLSDAGLDTEAVLVERPWVERAQFLTLLSEVDLYLDLPAFSGYTSAWHAIHVGLPVLTLEGRFLRQRLAAGLLRQVGFSEFIAVTKKDYVHMGARLTADSRNPDLREARRIELSAAAMNADHHVETVRAFEQVLLESLASRY